MVWRFGYKISMLYGTAQSQNVWVLVNGLGWMKLREGNHDAVNSMITMLTHAKANDRYVDIDEDPVSRVNALYVY